MNLQHWGCGLITLSRIQSCRGSQKSERGPLTTPPVLLPPSWGCFKGKPKATSLLGSWGGFTSRRTHAVVRFSMTCVFLVTKCARCACDLFCFDSRCGELRMWVCLFREWLQGMLQMPISHLPLGSEFQMFRGGSPGRTLVKLRDAESGGAKGKLSCILWIHGRTDLPNSWFALGAAPQTRSHAHLHMFFWEDTLPPASMEVHRPL